MQKRRFLVNIFCVMLLFLTIDLLSSNNFIIGAQSNFSDMGFTVPLQDTNASDGDIVCLGSSGYFLCKTEYDSSVYGVIDSSASANIQISANNAQVVVTRGEVPVKVSSVNGNVKKGDFITTSKTTGVGELSTNTGYVVGTALEDYSSSDKTAVGTILVALNIHANTTGTLNTRENLIDVLRSGLAGLGSNPIAALRYLLASVIVIISISIGFIYFGRIAKTGVEAIGRNPLAGIRIQTSVFLNILVMIAVIGAGLIIAYLVLAL